MGKSKKKVQWYSLAFVGDEEKVTVLWNWRRISRKPQKKILKNVKFHKRYLKPNFPIEYPTQEYC